MSFAIVPTLSSLMAVELHSASRHCWAKARLVVEHQEAAAFRLALHIAWNRCGGAAQYFNAWLGRYQNGPPHDPDLRACLDAFLGSESIGTPAEPAKDVHLQGFVAEHVWHLLTLENALGIGCPVRVDGPDWSVTDAGGDGLAVYRNERELSFRLWESKAHTGAGPIRNVVNGACRQVDSNALRYLARFSKVGQSINEPTLQRFYGQMPEMWRTANRDAGGGISVATASAAIDDCFGGLANYWAFTHNDQRQGLVVVIDDFGAFAQAVRKQLWKGL